MESVGRVCRMGHNIALLLFTEVPVPDQYDTPLAAVW